MKTRSRSLSLDSGLLTLYRPLIRRLLIVLAVTFVLAQSAQLYFDSRLVERLSANVIEQSSATLGANVQQLANMSRDAVRVAEQQLRSLDLTSPTLEDELAATLFPFLLTYSFLDSINVAATDGSEFVVIRDDAGFQTRRVDAATRPEIARWRRFRDGKVVEEWERAVEVDPTTRPFFSGAMAHEPDRLYWTEPYEFLTTGQPGVSVATRWPARGGDGWYVLAFNISLLQVSHFTASHSPSPNGLALVFDDQGRALGLPAAERYEDDRSILGATLVPVGELGLPRIDPAIESWEARDQAPGLFPYRGPGGSRWWGGFSPIRLDDETRVWSASLVPRSDMLGNLVTARNLTIIGISVAGVLAAAALLAAAMRSIRRQMKAAVDRVEQKLGQYQIEERIGEGGNGTVYRAHHALLRRPTALKLMNQAFARSDAARKRFEHEVRLTSSLSHPNTVAIYDFGRTADGTLYYAMELLDGATLRRIVEVGGPLSPGRLIHFLTQACGSLAEAHGRGLIHRDVKPSNLIACERGGLFDVLKVVDFGLVKEIAATDGNLTQADVLVGTPFFMAPETISRADAASPKSDLYALGAVAYFLLTGRQVFEGESAVEICAAHLHDAPVPPSERTGQTVPVDLESLVLACLAKDPAERPASAEALGESLLDCADAGSWGQKEARAWWRENGSGLAGSAGHGDEPPMSGTEMLVDLDSRLLTRGELSAADAPGR